MRFAATLKALGDDTVGIAVSQVVPFPTNPNLPLVREFLVVWKASGAQLEPFHLALEGYINAKVFAAALHRVWHRANRADFIESAWNLKNYDMDGVHVSFAIPGESASRFVGLTVVTSSGRFIR